MSAEDKRNLDALVEANSVVVVKGVDTTPSNGVSLSLEDSIVKVIVNTSELATSLVGSDEEVGLVSGVTIKVGKAVSDGNVEIIPATVTVHEAIQTLSDKIQSAVAGGVVSIVGDDYVSVSGTATAKVITTNIVKIANYMVDNNSALKVDEYGKLSLEWEIL